MEVVSGGGDGEGSAVGGEGDGGDIGGSAGGGDGGFEVEDGAGAEVGCEGGNACGGEVSVLQKHPMPLTSLKFDDSVPPNSKPGMCMNSGYTIGLPHCNIEPVDSRTGYNRMMVVSCSI